MDRYTLEENLIYIQEDLNLMVKTFTKKVEKNPKDKGAALKGVPTIEPKIIVKKAAAKDPRFNKDYSVAQRRLKEKGKTEEGKALSALYAVTKSAQRKNIIVKSIDRSIEAFFKHPERLAQKAAMLTLYYFLINILLGGNKILVMASKISARFMYLAWMILIVKSLLTLTGVIEE